MNLTIKCPWPGCERCEVCNPPSVTDVANIPQGENVTAVTAEVETKTVKSVTLKMDEESASRLYDVLYRHIGGASLRSVTGALAAAGVDTKPRYTNANKLRTNRYPSYGYEYGYTVLKDLTGADPTEDDTEIDF